MTKKYSKGDYNQDHCEIWEDGEYIGDVRTRDADTFIKLLNHLHKENERLHDEIFRLRTIMAYDRTVNDDKDWFKAEDKHFEMEEW